MNSLARHLLILLTIFSPFTFAGECFESGEIKRLPQGSLYGMDFPYGEYFGVGVIENQIVTIDFKKLEIKSIPLPNRFAGYPSILKNGSFASTDWGEIDDDKDKNPDELIRDSKKVKTTLLDPRTGATKVVTGLFEHRGELVSIVKIDKKSGMATYKKEDGTNFTEKMLDSNLENEPNYYTRGGIGEPELHFEIAKKKITILKDGKEIIHDEIDSLKREDMYFSQCSFYNIVLVMTTSLNDNENLSSTFKKDIRVYDLKKRTKKVIQIPAYLNPANSDGIGSSISPDGNSLILTSNKFVPFLLDLKTGILDPLDIPSFYNQQFDKDGHICGTSYLYDVYASNQRLIKTCFDKSNLKKPISTQLFPFGFNQFTELKPGYFNICKYNQDSNKPECSLFHPEKVCLDRPVSFSCGCKEDGPSIHLPVIEKLTEELACKAPFSESHWQSLAKKESENQDFRDALVWLKRFSKPGGFSPKEHAGIIVGILNENLQKTYPKEVSAALNGVLYASPLFFESLLQRFPLLNSDDSAPNNNCLTEDEQKKITEAVSSFVDRKLTEHPRPIYRELIVYANLIKNNLSEAKRLELAEKAADLLVVSAGDSYELNNIFPSKVYKFAENKMKSAFGLPYKNLTDLTVVRKGGYLTLLTLGVDSYEGAEQTKAGFYLRTIENIPTSGLRNVSTRSLTWNFGGKEYVSKVELIREELSKSIVSSGEAPNYSEMIKDKSYRGVVVVGANMGQELSDRVIKSYLGYFNDVDYEFDPAVNIPDLSAYLKEKVTGEDPMHYFIKEAHSDGDEKNLFRMPKKAKLLRGKKVVNGITESIDLIYPADSSSEHLSNSLFGEWMREREAKGMPELVYINSSCWSATKASYEVPAAKTPKFINLPTTTAMSVFTNSDDNAMYAIVNGFRERKSYSEIREMMKKDEDYAKGKANIMIFPDEDEYRKRLGDAAPIDVNVKLFVREQGELIPYAIDEVH